MTKLNTLIVAAGALLLSTAAFAGDTVTGAWTYQVGLAGGCTITLTQGTSAEDGTVASSDTCPGGLTSVTSWHLNGSTLELKSGSGELVALVHKTGAGFAGTQMAGGKKVTLTRA